MERYNLFPEIIPNSFCGIDYTRFSLCIAEVGQFEGITDGERVARDMVRQRCALHNAALSIGLVPDSPRMELYIIDILYAVVLEKTSGWWR